MSFMFVLQRRSLFLSGSDALKEKKKRKKKIAKGKKKADRSHRSTKIVRDRRKLRELAIPRLISENRNTEEFLLGEAGKR